MTMTESERELLGNVDAANLDKNQAKFFLALIALKRLELLSEANRSDLFAPTSLESASRKGPLQLKKQGLAKEWQRTFLGRLVDQGVLDKKQRGSQLLYSARAIDEVREITADAADGEGLMLKAILWPHLYPNEDVEDEPEEDEPEKQEESASGTLAELTKQLTIVAKSLHTIAGSFKAHEERLDSIEKSVAAMKLNVETIDGSFGETAQRMESLFSAVVDEDRKVLKDLATQTVESLARKKSLMNQIESALRKDEKTIEKLEQLANSLEEKKDGD